MLREWNTRGMRRRRGRESGRLNDEEVVKLREAEIREGNRKRIASPMLTSVIAESLPARGWDLLALQHVMSLMSLTFLCGCVGIYGPVLESIMKALQGEVSCHVLDDA